MDALLLSPNVLKGLQASGLREPSQVQQHCIPPAKFGVDLVVQSRAGSGKTAVFVVTLLERSLARAARERKKTRKSTRPVGMVLAPTREIVTQVSDVVEQIGRHCGVRVMTAIGGVPLKVNRKSAARGCDVVVGTPGRLNKLLESGILSADAVRVVVLDEADKLLEGSLQPQALEFLHRMPTEQRQTMVFSATYTTRALRLLKPLMKADTQVVRLSEERPSVETVQQFQWVLEPIDRDEIESKQSEQDVVFDAKCDMLTRLLAAVTFHQCVVFSNNRTSADQVVARLKKQGWPAAAIAGDMQQSERSRVMDRLRNMKIRVLVTTDLTARGVDVERVTLVVNLDLPLDVHTYLHRIGRTGRFGAVGMAVSFVSRQFDEHTRLAEFASAYDGIEVHDLPPLDQLHLIEVQRQQRRQKQPDDDAFQALIRKRQRALRRAERNKAREQSRKRKQALYFWAHDPVAQDVLNIRDLAQHAAKRFKKSE